MFWWKIGIIDGIEIASSLPSVQLNDLEKCGTIWSSLFKLYKYMRQSLLWTLKYVANYPNSMPAIKGIITPYTFLSILIIHLYLVIILRDGITVLVDVDSLETIKWDEEVKEEFIDWIGGKFWVFFVLGGICPK